MKLILLILTIALCSSSAWAFQEQTTESLVCGSHFFSNSGVGCVSKASIEKDKLQIQVLKLQLQELQDKAAERALVQQKAEAAEREKALKKLSPQERKKLGL